MSGRTSAAVEHALSLIRGGMTAYAAAKAAGIALSTIYRCAGYREIKNARSTT